MSLSKYGIAMLRGEVPGRCDFCGKETDFDNLEPEEAGDWVCHECLTKWMWQDVLESL